MAESKIVPFRLITEICSENATFYCKWDTKLYIAYNMPMSHCSFSNHLTEDFNAFDMGPLFSKYFAVV